MRLRNKMCRVIKDVIGSVPARPGSWQLYVTFFRSLGPEAQRLLLNILRDGHVSKLALRDALVAAQTKAMLDAVVCGNYQKIIDRFEKVCGKHRLCGEVIPNDRWGKESFSIQGMIGFARAVAGAVRRRRKHLVRSLSHRGSEWVRLGPHEDTIVYDTHARCLLISLSELPEADWRRILGITQIGRRCPGGSSFIWTSDDAYLPNAFSAGRPGRIRVVASRLGLYAAHGGRVLLAYRPGDLGRHAALRFPTVFDVGWQQGLFRTWPCTEPTGKTEAVQPDHSGLREALQTGFSCDKVLRFPAMRGG